MTKPKLSDALKAKENAGKQNNEADAAAESQTPESPAADPGAENADDDEPSSDSDDADPDDSEAVETGDEAGASTAATLKNFRAVFGHEQGSVFFADQTDFATACVSHIKSLNETIASQAAEIATLKATAKELGEKIAGEAEPVETAAASGESGSDADDGVSSFAAGLKLPGSE